MEPEQSDFHSTKTPALTQTHSEQSNQLLGGSRSTLGCLVMAEGAGGFHCQSSFMAEAEAMRAGLSECLGKGLRKIEVEVDAKGLVEMLKGGEVWIHRRKVF